MLTHNNKTPGPDGVLTELMKEGENLVRQVLKLLFNKYQEEEKIPENWNAALTILLCFQKYSNCLPK